MRIHPAEHTHVFLGPAGSVECSTWCSVHAITSPEQAREILHHIHMACGASQGTRPDRGGLGVAGRSRKSLGPATPATGGRSATAKVDSWRERPKEKANQRGTPELDMTRIVGADQELAMILEKYEPTHQGGPPPPGHVLGPNTARSCTSKLLHGGGSRAQAPICCCHHDIA